MHLKIEYRNKITKNSKMFVISKKAFTKINFLKGFILFFLKKTRILEIFLFFKLMIERFKLV
jgi:hypothetical protein